jgi:hypothetical protein
VTESILCQGDIKTLCHCELVTENTLIMYVNTFNTDIIVNIAVSLIEGAGTTCNNVC